MVPVSIIYVEENHKLIGTLKNRYKRMEEYNILLQDQMFKNSIYSNAMCMFAVNLKSRKVVIYQVDSLYHNVINVEYNDEFISNVFLKFIQLIKKEQDVSLIVIVFKVFIIMMVLIV